MNQRLITMKQRAQLLANGRAYAAGHLLDPEPVARLFTPDAHAMWLLATLDLSDGDTAWGLVDLGIGYRRHTGDGSGQLSDETEIVGPQDRPCPARCVLSRNAPPVGIRPSGAT
jgi:hypothetical protein